jgi:hypothetical protein
MLPLHVLTVIGHHYKAEPTLCRDCFTCIVVEHRLLLKDYRGTYNPPSYRNDYLLRLINHF